MRAENVAIFNAWNGFKPALNLAREKASVRPVDGIQPPLRWVYWHVGEAGGRSEILISVAASRGTGVAARTIAAVTVTAARRSSPAIATASDISAPARRTAGPRTLCTWSLSRSLFGPPLNTHRPRLHHEKSTLCVC